MSFFSTAGPAIVRRPTPSSSRTMCASDVLPRPGGPASSTWSSASPRAFAAIERDLELLLHALLPDELVERARAQRLLDRLLVVLVSSTGATNELMLPSAALAAHAPRASRSHRSARARARRRRASSRARRARRARRRGRRRRRRRRPARSTTDAASFSFSSSTMRSAVFLPMPGIAWKRAVSSRTIARRSSSAGEPETIASATFGPMPFTDRSWMKSSRSARSAKP